MMEPLPLAPAPANLLPPTLAEKVEQARAILDDARKQHSPVAVFAGFSGGNDSIVAAHIMMGHWNDGVALHINTGIGVEATREHVRRVAAEQAWPFWERHAAPGEYEAFVRQHGFPGPQQHPRMYQRLKERVVYAVCREAKEGHPRSARVMFVTGIRADESRIRSGYRRVVSKVRAQVWVNPIYYFTHRDRDAYIEAYGLPRNPTSAWLGMSGECLCGAFADASERALIRRNAPEVEARLCELETLASEAGRPWRWHDQGPPQWWTNEQRGQIALSFPNRVGPMCYGCGKSAD